MGFEIIGTDHLKSGSGVAAVLKAADKVSRQTADAELTREAFAAAVGSYDCPCGSVFDFCEASTLEDYAGLNRWLGLHFSDEHNATIDGDRPLMDALIELGRARKRENTRLNRDLNRAARDNDMLRDSARELLVRVDELKAELAEARRRVAS